MLQKLFNFISVLNRNSKVLQAQTEITFLTYFCLLNCQGYFPITLSVTCWPFQTVHIVSAFALFPLYRLWINLFFKKVTTQNATGSLAKRRLTYTEWYCDSQLFGFGLARESGIWIDVKQLWYCRVVLQGGRGPMHTVGTTH